jgi:hypothetical protein
MSGNLLRTAVYANTNNSYFALAGTVEALTSTINTQTINASTINLNQTGGFGDYAVFVSSTGTAQIRVEGGDPGFAEIQATGGFGSIVATGTTGYFIGGNIVGTEGAGCGLGISTGENRIFVQNNGTDGYYQLASFTGSGGTFAPLGKSQWRQYANGESNIIGLYDASDVLKASLAMNYSGVLIDNKPVASPSKVAYVGVSGTDISVPASTTQTISANFAVKNGHTYRVTVQCQLLNADATAGVFTELLLTTNPDSAVQQVGLGSVLSADSSNTAEKAYTTVFVATADSSLAHIVCVNSSATDASTVRLNAVDVANAPSVLVEDLGVI